MVERWSKAVSEGDAESALARLSEHPGTLVIGTDLAEWWHRPEARAISARQIEELGSFPFSCDEIEACEEGNVGWASVKETILWKGSRSIQGRPCPPPRTGRVEGRAGPLVVTKGEPRGSRRKLTVSLEELERLVQREQPDLSSTLAADGTVTIAFTDIVVRRSRFDGSVTRHRSTSFDP